MKLFEAGRIGTISIKNRVVMSAMGTGLQEPDGRFSSRDIDYYVARARGGVGLIISSWCGVDRHLELTEEGGFCFYPMADRLAFVNRFSELADAVHSYGAKLAIQLAAGCGRVLPLHLMKLMAPARPIAPSEEPYFFDSTVTTRALTKEEIKRLVRAFGFAAKVVCSAGVDAIEVNAMGGYLLDQFMTSCWNHRNDEYGGKLQGRIRLALEIIEAIKTSAGQNFPIIFKFPIKHYFEGGRDLEESLEIAQCLEKAGVDAIEASGASWGNVHGRNHPAYSPPGQWVELSRAVKNVVRIPVLVGGALGYPQLAETVLREGKADFVSLGKPLLADPEWANKVEAGRYDELKICIRDSHGCSGRRVENKYASCTLTPATGMERELAITPAGKKKSVLVIGGGPAGMEAARVAALRGHSVSLWERSLKLGGNLVPASAPEFKADIRDLIAYFSNQLRKVGVKVELSKEATVELVQKEGPEVLVVATGAIPLIPAIPGIEAAMENGRMITAVDLLLEKKEAGETVIVAGGGVVGCEVGLYLANKGRSVTILEMKDNLASDAYRDNRANLLYLLGKAGVELKTNATIVEIAEDGVVVKGESGRTRLQADTVVSAFGLRSEVVLSNRLKEGKPTPITIGDCVKPRRIIDAIWEGFRVGRLI